VPLVMGVDSSTQATKVEVRDADTGARVGAGRAPHAMTSPPRSEQYPEDWWDALVAARRIGEREHPADAVSVAAQQHGLVVLDDTGTVIRPAKLWNDTESAPDASWLRTRLEPGDGDGDGAAAWAAACGSVPVAAFTITKLSWLHRSEPEAFARIARVGLPHDWLAWRLTGEWTTDRGDASGTGYWSPAENRWRTDLLAIVDAGTDWASALPTVLDPLTATGTGDNMAAALGLGLRPGDVAVSLGTSGTVFAVSDTPTADPSGAVAGFADASGRFLPLVCTLNATRVTNAVARLLGVDLAHLDALASEAAPGAGGVTVLPYFDGERTPDRPDATGTVTGLRTDVTREQLARAAFEGVVCGLLDGLDALGAVGVPVDDGRLFLLGGGAQSPVYRRVVADLAQRVITVPDEPELVTAGAAVQAAARLHGRPMGDVQAAWDLGRGTGVEPAIDAARAEEIRATYASVRDAG
jgi:xylulokinase